MILTISILVWFILVLSGLTIMIKRYSYSDPADNPYENETLGLPKGVIRTILALTTFFLFSLFHMYDVFYEEISTSSIDTITELVAGFYFASSIVKEIVKRKKDRNQSIN